MEAQKDMEIQDMKMKLEAERARNLTLQASQRQQEFLAQAQQTEVQVRHAKLQRLVSVEKRLNDDYFTEKQTDSEDADGLKFDILDQLELKVKKQESQINDLKADLVKNVQLIQYLENQNQTLSLLTSSEPEAQLVKSTLEQKDDKIADLIKEIGLQDGLREQLESVQKLLSNVQNQAHIEEK